MSDSKKTKQDHERIELSSPVTLCGRSGRLNPAAVGWSKKPLHTCNLSGHWPRKKRWNYWCVTGKDAMFSITISDIDYAGAVFAYYLDFKTGESFERTVTVPFSRSIYLGDTVQSLSSFQNDDVDVQFVSEGDGYSISLSWLNFAPGKDLSAELLIAQPKKHESLNVVVPWSTERFQFTSKQNALPASGFFSIGEKKYQFSPKESFACLDFGRGIWPYFTRWNWGSFSGYSGKDLLGVNMGALWTDGTGVTENAVTVNGKITAIKEKIQFEYDCGDFMKPWTIRTEKNGSVDLVFTPFHERKAKSNLLIVASTVHQLFGRYEGTVIAGRRQFDVKGVVGWAEEHSARW